MAPVISALKKSSQFEVRTCITAQHREMLDQVLTLFGIIPDYDLDLMKSGQDLTDISMGVLNGLRPIIAEWNPNWILVHGDTTTAFSASLAGFYGKVLVAHIEAGLRTGDKYSPFPEEMNRRLTASIANLHFAPTVAAKENLLKEGVKSTSIFITGNTVIDALFEVKKLTDLAKNENFPWLRNDKRLILVTAHRRENFGKGFENICDALVRLVDRGDVQIIFPVHPNPNVRNVIYQKLGEINDVHLVEPLTYFEMVYLLSKATLVITDSGGLQEEAPSLGIPVLVLREATERPEAIQAGTALLVGTRPQIIIEAASRLLDSNIEYQAMAAKINPYGDGKAAKKIAKIFEHYSIERY